MTDIQQALLGLNKTKVSFQGRRYQINCWSCIDTWNVERFHLDATVLNPQTPDEAKYCVWDLWQSDSDRTHLFINKLQKMATAGTQPVIS